MQQVRLNNFVKKIKCYGKLALKIFSLQTT
jgi:hypothetical protein